MKNFAVVIFTILFQISAIGQDSLQPPQNIQAEVFNNSVTLFWTSPPMSADYLSWENGLISNSIGISSDGTFAVAAKWEPQQIPELVGEQIEKVSIHTAGENSTYTLKIWKGINAESLVLSQDIENIISNQWFDVVLDSAITIDDDLPVWVGYEVNQPATDYPASIDTGPAAAGYGDLIFWEGAWTTLSAFGFSNNWSIRAYTSASGEQMALLPGKSSENNLINNSSGNSPFTARQMPDNPESLAGLQGFNIYVDGEQVNQQLVTFNNYYAGIFNSGTYSFGVTAVYDEGESEPAELEIELGGGFLTFDPSQLNIDIPSEEITEVPITLSNPGESAIDWFAFDYQPWLSLSTSEGTVQPNSSDEISFIIDATSLEPGYYYADVIFTFNNVVLPQSYYFISLFVEGDPEISINPEELNFGNVETGSTKALSFQLFNEGFSTVMVDSIVSGSSAFVVNNQGFELYPWEHTSIGVIFAPDSIATFTSEILIYTDFSQEPFPIAVSGSGVLAAPFYLNAELVNDNDAELSWLPPDGAQGSTLNWDSGENFTSVGLGGDAVFHYGARWTPEFLSDADGKTALSVSFFPAAEQSTFTLNIYTGENAQNLIHSQPVAQYDPYQWNNVNINTPFEIDGSEELWVTFEVNNAQGEFPGGVDAGPAVEGFGDMVSLDGVVWESMNQLYFLPYNWNIQLFASDEFTASAPVSIPRSNVAIENNLSIQVDESYRNPENASIAQGASALNFEFLGYNVYRNDIKLNAELISELTFLDTGLQNGIYEYGVTAVYDEGESPKTTDVIQIGTPEISFDPESLTVELNTGEIVTDTITIFNTGTVEMLWEASSNASFVIPAENSGSVLPGESQQLEVIVDATFIGGGTINTLLNFSINNLNNPTTSYPVIVSVEGVPDLYVISQELNFGNVAPGTTKTRMVEIFNFGFGSAEIFNLATNSEAFFVNDTIYTISPQQTIQIPVQFVPSELNEYSGTLSFSTSDTNLPSVEISLAGSGFLMPPLALSASTDENNVELSWLPPDGGEGNYLQYDDGENFQSIGLSGGGSFAVAAKWDADQLFSNTGNYIASVGFYPTTVNSDFTVKIWKGSNADSILISQVVTDYNPYAWNDIFLTSPVEILENETYWIGYEVNHPDNEFPAGTDDGPAISGMGDMLTLDGQIWESLSNYGLNYNWNIRAFVSETNNGLNPATSVVNVINYENTGDLVKRKSDHVKQNTLKSTSTIELLGYNIYRDSIQLNVATVQETTFTDEGLEFGTYNYQVTAVYDFGESGPAGPVEVMVEEPVQMPEGWEHSHTETTHIIYVPTGNLTSGATLMEEGDWLGVFYVDNGMEYCAGAATWHMGDTLKVVAFGDDPETAQKEGFELGENITWKAFMENSGETHQLGVTYHSGMPDHNGTFNALGLSMLTSIDLIPTGFEDIISSELLIYPNPGNGKFVITASDNIDEVKILNLTGQEIYRQDGGASSSMSINLTGLYRGTYFAKIKLITGHEVAEKIIIR